MRSFSENAVRLIIYTKVNHIKFIQIFTDKSDVTSVTPGLRKRRERVERHKSFLKEQQQANALLQTQGNNILGK